MDAIISNVGSTIVWADDMDGSFVLWNGEHTFNLYSDDGETMDAWMTDTKPSSVHAASANAAAHVAALVATAIGADDACPLCSAQVEYVAEIGDPGIGQAWRCANSHALVMIGGELYDAMTNHQELTIDDVR